MKARYEIMHVLGEGSFGVVYLGFDQYTQSHVAIKQLKDTSSDGRQRFRREMLALSRQLNNQFIVDVLDHDLDDDPPYIVLEYCEHGSLRGWVGQGRPWRDVVVALAQVLQGIEKIHEIGGFHRDLKPDNLLLATGPTPGTIVVKVADFGLARVPDSRSTIMTRHFGGTDGYIAPEVVGGKDYHPGADIYSLGIVATELLTGARDLAGLHQVEVPPRLRELVAAMCSTDSTRRPAARQVAVVLNELLKPPPVPQPPPALPPPTPPSSGGATPALVIGGAALFVAGLVALAAFAGGEETWDAEVRRYRGTDGRFRRG
jgi:serine/threonine-protein kinase